MAIETKSRLVDDVDKTSTAVGAVQFSFNGKDYEIDLSQEHIDEFTDQMQPWITNSRKRGAPRRAIHQTVAPAVTSSDDGDWWAGPKWAAWRKKARAWGRQQPEFRKLGDLGRLPRALVERYVDEECGGTIPLLDELAGAAK
jgi:hypothetical protein